MESNPKNLPDSSFCKHNLCIGQAESVSVEKQNYLLLFQIYVLLLGGITLTGYLRLTNLVLTLFKKVHSSKAIGEPLRRHGVA